MSFYVPGTEEKDPKKVIMSLQQAHDKTATNTTDIATNTADIATNAADIAAIQAAIAGPPWGTGSVTSVGTSGLATGGPITTTGTVTVTAATQSDQETGTSTTTAVTPGVQRHHPTATKAWANFLGSDGNIGASYGVSNVSRTGTGTYTLTFTAAFSSASAYAAIGSTEHNGANTFVKFGSGGNKTTTTIAIFVLNLSGTLTDPDYVNVCFYGDQ